MRRDMSKLLVERPRIGGKYTKHRRDRLTNPPEDGPRGEAMQTKWVRRKMLNENLAPLRRFLRSRVGRPWNAVYSEIREHVRVDSAIQLHILQHLWDYVVRDVILIDGVPCHGSNESWGRRLGLPIGEHRTTFYVHPESGLLLAARQSRRKKLRKPRLRHRLATEKPRTLSDGRQLHRIGGAWHAVELAPLVVGLPADLDVVLGIGPLVPWQHGPQLTATYGRSGVYGVRAERLTPRELARLGLA